MYGATDDIGMSAIEGVTTLHDLHATILHQLGLDHRTLTFEHSGREESLTDASVSGAKVVNQLLAHPAGPVEG